MAILRVTYVCNAHTHTRHTTHIALPLISFYHVSQYLLKCLLWMLSHFSALRLLLSFVRAHVCAIEWDVCMSVIVDTRLWRTQNRCQRTSRNEEELIRNGYQCQRLGRAIAGEQFNCCEYSCSRHFRNMGMATATPRHALIWLLLTHSPLINKKETLRRKSSAMKVPQTHITKPHMVTKT